MAQLSDTAPVQPPPDPAPFAADPADELPVGLQLSWRLRALIASGRLSPGDRLPGVRTLAEWAGVNVNTVRSVYHRLEEEGVVVTQHGSGSFIAAGAPSSPELERIAAEAIEGAREAGINPRELALVAWVCASVPEGLAEDLPAELEEGTRLDAEPEPDLDLAELPDLELPSDERGARRELRRQIARLEAQLAGYARELRREEPAAGGRPREGHVAGVEELETIRDTLLEQLAAARAVAGRRAGRERQARERRDAMVADPGAHRWEVVSSDEAGEPGCKEWEVSPRYGPLGVLMSWWRVKVSGGCPLAAPREAAALGDRVSRQWSERRQAGPSSPPRGCSSRSETWSS